MKNKKKAAKAPAKKDCPESPSCRKTATDNQWVSTGLNHYPDHRERRDGPGGEDADG